VIIIPNVIYDQLIMIPWSLLPCICSWRINRSDVQWESRNISQRESGILLCLWTLFLSTTGATIDVAARGIKLNISRKEQTLTFKPKSTKKYNRVMVMIRPERNAMTPDKKPNAAENFSIKFSRRVKNATLVVTRSPIAPKN
jgi:hypothetical protein